MATIDRNSQAGSSPGAASVLIVTEANEIRGDCHNTVLQDLYAVSGYDEDELQEAMEAERDVLGSHRTLDTSKSPVLPVADSVWFQAHLNMTQAIAALPLAERCAYQEALEQAPHVVQLESPLSRFLKCHNLDYWAAAQGLCAYWTKRRDVFGKERYARPLTLVAGESLQTSRSDNPDDEGHLDTALSKHARQILQSGVIVPLSPDPFHRPILLMDRQQILQKDGTVTPDYWTDEGNAKAQAFFYALQTMSESQIACQHGFVGILANESAASTDDERAKYEERDSKLLDEIKNADPRAQANPTDDSFTRLEEEEEGEDPEEVTLPPAMSASAGALAMLEPIPLLEDTAFSIGSNNDGDSISDEDSVGNIQGQGAEESTGPTVVAPALLESTAGIQNQATQTLVDTPGPYKKNIQLGDQSSNSPRPGGGIMALIRSNAIPIPVKALHILSPSESGGKATDGSLYAFPKPQAILSSVVQYVLNFYMRLFHAWKFLSIRMRLHVIGKKREGAGGSGAATEEALQNLQNHGILATHIPERLGGCCSGGVQHQFRAWYQGRFKLEEARYSRFRTGSGNQHAVPVVATPNRPTHMQSLGNQDLQRRFAELRELSRDYHDAQKLKQLQLQVQALERRNFQLKLDQGFLEGMNHLSSFVLTEYGLELSNIHGELVQIFDAVLLTTPDLLPEYQNSTALSPWLAGWFLTTWMEFVGCDTESKCRIFQRTRREDHHAYPPRMVQHVLELPELAEFIKGLQSCLQGKLPTFMDTTQSPSPTVDNQSQESCHGANSGKNTSSEEVEKKEKKRGWLRTKLQRKERAKRIKLLKRL
eukprot:CAMPEP_0172450266 /NCGR_PEP_ID=MMETSP1065-20121228/8682_1 /TAXON_ID=265537 /ORGANISM="Amphiprora paludosa, Strain CCMP125" /LENGTH=821 /DNA_ID=CAMNT_0013202045 /DNA_START=76 /DNA_END=2541 /DNA_ORIENTATION=-